MNYKFSDNLAWYAYCSYISKWMLAYIDPWISLYSNYNNKSLLTTLDINTYVFWMETEYRVTDDSI